MRTTTALKTYFLLFLAIFPGSCDRPPEESKAEIRRPAEIPGSAGREQWIDRMHRRPPGLDWRQIEYQNQQRLSPPGIQPRNTCGIQHFAQDQLVGRWIERGSRNQAGSVLDINYRAEQDQIWVISAGGSLWRRSRQKNDWTLINQKVQLNRGFLEFSPHHNHDRILAFVHNWLHYSDDEGQSWRPANKKAVTSDYPGYFGHPVRSQGQTGVIAYLSKPSFWSNLQILYSRDDGESLQSLTLLEDHDLNNFDLVAVPDSDDIWLLQRSQEKNLQIYRLDFVRQQLQLLNPDSRFAAGDAPLEATFGRKADKPALYTYIEEEATETTTYHYSSNQGQHWTLLSELPITPWPHTLHINTDQPDLHYLGGVEAYQSTNGGKSWDLINYWWEYYEDIEQYLHADMMHIRNFTSADGQDFTLISNHGGLNLSYDDFESMENLGLDALNVSQYYSVRSHPDDPRLIYAGSQDQGLQASLDEQPDSLLHFDQLIGGDYGHLSFSADGHSLWAVYPGGWVVFIEDVYTGQVTASFDLESPDETVWLPPLHAGVSLTEKNAYLAGGHPDGEAGSYLIELRYQDGEISASSQSPDFLAEAIDGTLSAIEIAPGDSSYQYLATTNGRFFYSRDGGQHWQQSLEFIPTGNYLYGQAIQASAKNPQEVYLAGSGYANPAVFYSNDGGRTFVDKSAGLPPTLVYDLHLDPAEHWLFAATEAGPFVLDLSRDQWHYLGNACTPQQTYWSVEYLADQNRVRFGTYGRGIWDFEFRSNPSTANTNALKKASAMALFPNPTTDLIWIDHVEPGPFQLRNARGQVVKSGQLRAERTQISLGNLPHGMYYLQLSRPGAVIQRIVKH